MDRLRAKDNVSKVNRKLFFNQFNTDPCSSTFLKKVEMGFDGVFSSVSNQKKVSKAKLAA